MSQTEWMRRVAGLLGYFEMPDHLRSIATSYYNAKRLPEYAAKKILEGQSWGMYGG